MCKSSSPQFWVGAFMYFEVLIKLQDRHMHGARVLTYNVLGRDSKRPKGPLTG